MCGRPIRVAERRYHARSMLTRRDALRVLGIGSGAALLAACSPGAAPPTPVPTTPPLAKPTAGAAPTQAAASTSQVAFRVDEASDVASLNPLLFNATPTRRRAVLMFSGLYQYDAKRNLVPDLAESMPQMPDPQTYSVKL